jgi:hypothetical protein
VSETPAKGAFLFVGVLLRQPYRDREAEHPIAQEFEPFVGALARARRGAVRQCFLQQAWIGEAMPEEALDRRATLRRQQLSPDRFGSRDTD